MIFHKYDTQPIMLTIPQLYDFDSDEEKLEKIFGDELIKFKNECNNDLLSEIASILRKNS